MTPSAEPTSKWERQTGKPMTAVLHTREGPALGRPRSCASAEEGNPTGGGSGGAGRLQTYLHDS